LLSQLNAQTPSGFAFRIKITQSALERNYGDAIWLLQARQSQFHLTSESDKAGNQLVLAWAYRLAGDAASAKSTAEQARNTLEQLCKDEPDNPDLAGNLALANAVLGKKTQR